MKFEIEQIKPEFDLDIKQIIQSVGAEFGAIGDGFGPSDAEVSAMSEHYTAVNRSRYFVARLEGKVIGGAGIAPFGQYGDVCELKKLFILPECRGLGVGKALSECCLEYARNTDFKRCYLDTLSTMHSAIALYARLGFTHLSQPLEGTIHNGCDVWMLKELE